VRTLTLASACRAYSLDSRPAFCNKRGSSAGIPASKTFEPEPTHPKRQAKLETGVLEECIAVVSVAWEEPSFLHQITDDTD
jgi:hypothetical protein